MPKDLLYSLYERDFALVGLTDVSLLFIVRGMQNIQIKILTIVESGVPYPQIWRFPSDFLLMCKVEDRFSVCRVKITLYATKIAAA